MQTGFVYKLFSPSTNKIYVGSTALSIADRLTRHKASFRSFNRNRGRYSSAYELLMYPNVGCETIEIVHYNDKEFLRERETHHITNNNCVNKRNAKFDYETYYFDNKERLKGYYQRNKEQRESKHHLTFF